VRRAAERHGETGETVDRAARGAVPEREGVGVEVGVRGAEAVRAELGGRGVARDCERPDASWESVAV
jgi:hypothetical protein